MATALTAPMPLARALRPGGYSTAQPQGLLELLLAGANRGSDISQLPTLAGASPTTRPPSSGQVQEYSAQMQPTDTSVGAMAAASENPYAARPGILGAIFGADSGVGKWTAENRGLLQGIGSALLSDGMDFSQLPRFTAMDDERRMKASEWAKGQGSKNGLLFNLKNAGPDYADILEGLEGGYLDQNDAFKAWSERRSQLAEQAKISAKNKGNATFINDPELRAAVEAGALPFAEAYKLERSPDKFINAGDGNLFNTGSGEWLSAPGANAPDLKELFGFEKDLYAQYANSDPAKTYEAVKGGYERVRESAQQQSGAGDMAMLYGYMRMLDPGSVVRESEFAMAAQAGDFGEQVQGMVSRLLNGQRLPETQRQEFLANAEKLYGAAAGNLTDINSQFTDRAAGYGVDPSRFIRQPEQFPAFGQQPQQITDAAQYQALPSGTQYVAPDGTVRVKP
ncbi:MAG TPA: hypothetical protein VGV07_21855 [Devosia sp.]|jgi:hypothetical protein|uniref:hypothetical protein n=1 Tax=Devosia sp. TaxID=1871048 RepID=UPI002DDD115F|nr:hypothetical protein [Devosia sp.]HEV2517912.1 hypothetical protein [Devosia sp.]